MKSGECQVIVLGRWLFFALLVSAVQSKKLYTIDYGDGLGEATVEINEESRTASVTPFASDSPSTLINFKKGIIVYVAEDACMVTGLPNKEKEYQLYINRNVRVNQVNRGHSPLYAMDVIPPKRARLFIGDKLYAWCIQKPTLRLGRRKPELSSKVFSLRGEKDTLIAKQGPWNMDETEHFRYKRRAGKERKSRKKKSKSSKRHRGKRKKSKSKKTKKPKTKSLSSRPQMLNFKAPRFSFPSAALRPNFTDDIEDIATTGDHVILQEEPYLSPSFVRSDEDSQRFRHYRDFYQELDHENKTSSSGHKNRIISHDPSLPVDGEARISIPETIVKDGQIFYRYDAEDSASSSTKEQSKRSHVRDSDYVLDADARLEGIFEHHNSSGDDLSRYPLQEEEEAFSESLAAQSIPEDLSLGHDHHTPFAEHDFSHVHTQPYVSDRSQEASSGSLLGRGLGIQTHGISDSQGFFIAQAQSIGSRNGSTNLAHVFGNQPGVMGVAMASGKGRQSHVQVDMGEQPSSTAHVTSHDGSALLSSSVHATHDGGRAGAHAYGDGTSTSNAHMEFIPTSHYGSSYGRPSGQGTASAIVTDSGSSLITSLSGEIPRGSYLGTAHSSLINNNTSTSKNATLSTHEEFDKTSGLQNEFGQDGDLSSFSEGKYYYEDPMFQRERINQIHHGEDLTELSYRTQESSPYIGYPEDYSLPEHSPDGGMIDDIMETVHQPHMQPEFIVYPASEFSIIDDGGLAIGAGIPPRESEIEQTPITTRRFEGDVDLPPRGSKSGIVGLATYSQGEVGAPPGPGELLSYPKQPESHYDYSYDDRYDNHYYDENYESLSPDEHGDLPFIDLGPQIVDFEPIDSNFESLQPIHLAIPEQPVVGPSPEWAGHVVSPAPHLQVYSDSDIQDITPNPPIIVHQVQAPTLLPEDVSGILAHTPLKSFTKFNVTSSAEDEKLVYPYQESDEVPTLETTTRISDPVISTETSPLAQNIGLALPQITNDSHSSVDTHFGTLVSREPVKQISQQPYSSTTLTQVSLPPGSIRRNVSTQVDNTTSMMMMGVPLDPGNPGSMHTLPGSEGGPDVKVMSLSASAARDRSIMRQHQGTFLQPGEKIPGAPGYKIPKGFRGRVVLGAIQGDGGQMQMSPQLSWSESATPGQFAGGHMSLAGESGSHTLSRAQDRGHAGPLHQMPSHSFMRLQPSSPGKSWGGRHQSMPTPQKSWDSSQHTSQGDPCGYYSMECQDAFGPHERREICKPVLITIGCCC